MFEICREAVRGAKSFWLGRSNVARTRVGNTRPLKLARRANFGSSDFVRCMRRWEGVDVSVFVATSSRYLVVRPMPHIVAQHDSEVA